MPAPQTISVDLTQDETDYIWNFVTTEYPNLTGAQVLNRLEKAAKEGIVTFIKEEVRRQNRAARDIAEQQAQNVFEGIQPATP